MNEESHNHRDSKELERENAGSESPGLVQSPPSNDSFPEDTCPDESRPDESRPDESRPDESRPEDSLAELNDGVDDDGEPASELPASGSRLLRYSLPSLAVAGGLGLYQMARRFQHSHMFVPSRYPEGPWEADEHGLDVQDVFFESEDGTSLHGWWLAHHRPSHRRMTVLYCHGNTGNIAERSPIFKYLQQLQANVFAFDYRGYGRSGGVPTELGVCADVRAAIDYVIHVLGVPAHRIILFGHSLGGAIAIDGAFHRRRLAGLVVQSSFTQNLDIARHFYPGKPVHLITKNGFRSIDKVPHLPMPKLFIHGRADPKIPFEHGEQLFEAAAEPKSFLAVARATHNDVHLLGGLKYTSVVTRFGREARAWGDALMAGSDEASSDVSGSNEVPSEQAEDGVAKS